MLLPVPLFAANLMATFFKFCKTTITKDQLNLLFYDNVPSGKYKTNFDINKNFKLKFEEVEKCVYVEGNRGICKKKILIYSHANFDHLCYCRTHSIFRSIPSYTGHKWGKQKI